MRKIWMPLLLAVLLFCAACGGSVVPAPTEEETTASVAATEAVPTEIILNDAERAYVIIRPDICSDMLTEAASALCMELREIAGETKLRIGTDWVQNEADAQNDNYEILIGGTNRPQSTVAAAQLASYLDFVIAVDGNKISIAANTDERLCDAIAYFRAQLQAVDGRLIYPSGTTYIGKYTDYAMPVLTIGGAAIETFSIILPANAQEREQKLAEELQTYIKCNQGAILPILADTSAVSANEILIGRTNRPESAVSVAEEGVRYMTSGGKLVLLAGSPAYYPVVKNQLFSLLEVEKGVIAEGLDASTTYTGMAYFTANNYAADLIDKIDEDLNLGVQALLSCCEYYNDSMRADSKKGNKWIYSSNAKYVTQVCRFDDMLNKFTAKGGNCAAPVNWAFIDMEIMPDTYRFWGDSSGDFARREKVEPYVGLACEIFDVEFEGKTFMTLYNEGRIKTGDILLGKGHTFIYRGAQSFYAAGHDSDWHSDPTVVSEDKRKAVFDNWVLSFAECPSNCKYGVNYIIRIKDDYIPKYFRNQTGELVENSVAIAEAK